METENKNACFFNEEPKCYGETSQHFQIKRFDDSNFKINLSIMEEQNSFEEALTKLGYFIVPESYEM